MIVLVLVVVVTISSSLLSYCGNSDSGNSISRSGNSISTVVVQLKNSSNSDSICINTVVIIEFLISLT